MQQYAADPNHYANRHSRPETTFGRVLPHNIEAEQALLGLLLSDNRVIDRMPELRMEHFYDPLHRDIFVHISKRVSGGDLVSPITLAKHFEEQYPDQLRRPPDQRVRSYLAKLVANAPVGINAKDYCRVIINLVVLRGAADIGNELINATCGGPVDLSSNEIIERFQAKLDALKRLGPNERPITSLEAAIDAAILHAVEAYQRGTGLAGLSTGYGNLDELTGGLKSGDLILLGARPSMGKTALATGMALHGSENGVSVLFSSQEMKARSIANRILAGKCKISALDLECGLLGDNDEKVGETMRALIQVKESAGKIPLLFDDAGGVSIQQLVSRARSVLRHHRIGLLVVDYIQLMSASTYRGVSRNLELSEVSGRLKALAKELDIPVLALSQLNRATETRDNKRPMLSDLRDSGGLEQDADLVMFLHREEYYLERSRPDCNSEEYEEWLARLEAASGKATVIVAKARSGRTGTVDLAFDGPTMTFSTVAASTQPAGLRQ